MFTTSSKSFSIMSIHLLKLTAKYQPEGWVYQTHHNKSKEFKAEKIEKEDKQNDAKNTDSSDLGQRSPSIKEYRLHNFIP